jgi:hypothetical protein
VRRLPQPDPDDTEIQPVHCFGCGRHLGVAPEVKSAVFCTELCWHKQQVIGIENAARDRAIRYLADHGIANVAMAEAFGVTRTRVFQIIAQSNIDYLRDGRAVPLSAAELAVKSKAGKISASRRRKSA